MTRYEMRQIGQMVYGAAALVARVAILCAAANQRKDKELADRAEGHYEELVALYRNCGGRADGC